MDKINKVKACFFEKIRKIDKPLDRLFLKERERKKIRIFTVRNKRSYITIAPIDIKRKIRQYHKQFYANLFNNLNIMDKFLLKTPQLATTNTGRNF